MLQNGVWSNALPFALNTLHIASINPTSGSAGTAVTITGTGFGTAAGAVLLGSLNGQVLLWSDTQVVAAVAAGAVTGVARVQQNGAWSNALTFTVPAGGNAVALTPNLVSAWRWGTRARSRRPTRPGSR